MYYFYSNIGVCGYRCVIQEWLSINIYMVHPVQLLSRCYIMGIYIIEFLQV